MTEAVSQSDREIDKSAERAYDSSDILRDQRGDLGAILPDLEGRHGADAALRADILAFVNVHLDELKRSVAGSLGELDEVRADHLAGAAPRGGEVDDHGLGAGHELIELGLVGDLLDHDEEKKGEKV